MACLGDSQHVVPGTGSLIAAVSFVSQRQPDAWCGKPSPFMFTCIKVGDREISAV